MIRQAVLAAAVFVAAPAFAEPQTAPAAVAHTPSAKMGTEAQRLDLNSATVEQLATVKGLNKTVAEAIVKARPFKSVEDLTAKKIVSAEVFTSVRDHLMVR